MRNRHLRVIILACITLLSFGCTKKNFFAATPLAAPEQYQQLEKASPAEVDSVVLIPGKHYQRSGFHHLIWGKHYRQVWAAPVKVRVFDMNRIKGGLQVEKLGGGMQTTSLTLTDKSGFSYALRSLDKDPVTVLPKLWQNTFVADVLRDQTSAINPYAALVLPPLATAAGIPHASPELVYVLPADTTFGEYQKLFQNQVFLIEEKFNDNRSITPDLGDAVDIVSSKKMLKNRFAEGDHLIDQRAFAKARLFDLLIHDWDRHEGQWEWAVYTKDSDNFYRPIPKDRDNAFYYFEDGLIPWLFSRKWAIRKFKSFKSEYHDVEALMVNAEFIDRRALTALTAQEFQDLARELQEAITDEVIEQAVRQYPDTVFHLIGESTRTKLRNRRDKLHEAAQKFYEVLARDALVIGTDQEEKFEVKRLNDEETAVTVYRKTDGKQVYHRVFRRNETKQITLHGLAEDDEFDISGEVSKGIRIVVIGGRGEDKIRDTSHVKGWRKKAIVYDTRRGTELELGPSALDKTTRDVRVHAFDREGH